VFSSQVKEASKLAGTWFRLNGPIYEGIFTNICSLFPSPNFPFMIVPTQVAWFQKSIPLFCMIFTVNSN